MLESAIKDVNEIMRSKVAALGGNCLLGYRIHIFKLQEEFDYNRESIFFAVTAIGDAVELEVIQKKCGL